jgi:hypothetical protein
VADFVVLYHGACPDGMTAAWAAWKKLGDKAEYVPAFYGEPCPVDVTGKFVYLLDFSYKRAAMEELISKATLVVVLDHHQTAADELRELTIQKDRVLDADGVVRFSPTIVFDLTKSGARLAWEYFHADEPVPLLVQYAEDRDLWKFALPYSRQIANTLTSYPFTLAAWDQLAGRFPRWREVFPEDEVVADGRTLLRYKQVVTELIAASAVEQDWFGHQVLVANSPVMQSEVAGTLAEGRPFGVVWFVRAKGIVQYSLRSTPTGVDVSAIAKQLGGGGHTHAAGFERPSVRQLGDGWVVHQGKVCVLHRYQRDEPGENGGSDSGSHCRSLPPVYRDELAAKQNAELHQQVQLLRAAVKMEGAPHAPCAGCRHLCGNRIYCGCDCHKLRVEYIEAQLQAALLASGGL